LWLLAKAETDGSVCPDISYFRVLRRGAPGEPSRITEGLTFRAIRHQPAAAPTAERCNRKIAALENHDGPVSSDFLKLSGAIRHED